MSGIAGDAAGIIAPGHRDLGPQQPRHAPGDFPLWCLLVAWEKSLMEEPASLGEVLAQMSSEMGGQTRSVLGPAAVGDEARPPRCPPCSPSQWHTQRPACSTGLVFHTADMCGQRGQPRAQARAPSVRAHTSAAGPEAVVPPSALVAPGWEAQSRLNGFSITRVGSALGCLIPGMWLFSGCGGAAGCWGPHGTHVHLP